jgi:hypothetical protein
MFDLQAVQLQGTPISSTIVWVDNTAALAVATGNDFTHATVKLVTVKVRFLQGCVKHKIVRLTCVGNRKNISDMMTKQSNGQQYRTHRDFSLGYVDEVSGQHLRWKPGTALRLRQRCCS